MSGTDPLNLLLSKKKEQQAQAKYRQPSAADQDVSSALSKGRDAMKSTLSPGLPVASSNGGSGAYKSAQLSPAPEEDDPFTLVVAPESGTGRMTSSSGVVGHSRAATIPEDDPFTLVINPEPIASSMHTSSSSGALARDAFGVAAGAAGMALSAVGGLLRSSATSGVVADQPRASDPGLQAKQRGSGSMAGLGNGHSPPPSISIPRGKSRTVDSNMRFQEQLQGEKVIGIVLPCFLSVSNPLCELEGRLLLTNYRLKFEVNSLRDELSWMRQSKYFDIPYGVIHDIQEEKSSTVTGAVEYKLKVSTKDHRTLAFLAPTAEDAAQVIECWRSCGLPGNPALLFAFKHAEAAKEPVVSKDLDGWSLYDPLLEYGLMGIETDSIAQSTSPWRLSSVNAEYALCSTYPAWLALPRRMTEQELRAVSGFRKRGRLPAMSWCGGPQLNYASLWRCSQTTEGLMFQKCPEDQKMVESIWQGAQKPGQQPLRDLLVIDLRPWKSAWANKAGGGGFEGYPCCRLIFGGIDNIHAVKSAWKAMGAAVAAVSDGEVGSWFRDVANSCWYDYIGAVLSCTTQVIKEIKHHKSSAMIHCSDGWDRTAQVSSLSMLCLDQRWRTQEGFLRLIQKEWCSFGHRFRTRLALGEQVSDEYSPVFLQWLECVLQLLKQFPREFEFSQAVLLRLASEAFSNRFGTFLCDNEKERQDKVKPFAISLWSVLLRAGERETWRNPSYNPSLDLLVPRVCQANYAIWNEFWLRYHPLGQELNASEEVPDSSQYTSTLRSSSPGPHSMTAHSTVTLSPSNSMAAASGRQRSGAAGPTGAVDVAFASSWDLSSPRPAEADAASQETISTAAATLGPAALRTDAPAETSATAQSPLPRLDTRHLSSASPKENSPLAKFAADEDVFAIPAATSAASGRGLRGEEPALVYAEGDASLEDLVL